MATYDLEEQEQLDEIKTWWKQHGNLVVTLVTAASICAIAWQGWNWYQRSQTAQASMVYGVVQKAALEKNSQQLKAATGELVDKFGGTTYASLAALTAAKALFDAGDVKTAKVQLNWVAENGKNELRDLARLRLAAVLLDEKAYDEALKQLNGSFAEGFGVRFSESRGDVLNAQGKKAEARSAYQSALNKLDETDKSGKGKNSLQDKQANGPYREMLQQKLDSLGESS